MPCAHRAHSHSYVALVMARARDVAHADVGWHAVMWPEGTSPAARGTSPPGRRNPLGGQVPDMTEHKRLSRADRDALGRQNHADLMRLREGWDQVYLISVTFPDNWQAIRIGEPE